MRELILTSRQRMLSPDQLSFELGLTQTPEQMENTKIATYILVGVLATITVGIIVYAIHQDHQKKKYFIKVSN